MNQTKVSIAYLSCPYSNPDPKIRKMRELMVTEVSYELIKDGIYVYSPITHNAPINSLGIHGTWQEWQIFDHEMVSRCDKLYILKLPGWEHSKGVAAEIEAARRMQKPIEDLHPKPERVEAILKSLDHSPFDDLLRDMHQFYTERDWHQFHSPKNLVMELGSEVGELMDRFRYFSEENSYHVSGKLLENIQEEIGDILISLLNLSHKLKINPLEAAKQKLLKTGEKYPVEKSKGKHKHS